MINLNNYYKKNIIPHLIKKFRYKNIHSIPKLTKICINAGLGLKAQNKKFLDKSINDISLITGQYPIVTKSKKAIAGFKLRKDTIIGLKVTLRKQKMYAFLERLIHLVFPRIRDFKGLNFKNFDKFGNYSFGINDQQIFPEIDYELSDDIRGYNINLIFNTNNNCENFFLLQLFGFPFQNYLYNQLI